MNEKDNQPQPHPAPHRRTLFGAFRANFLTGLGVILPIGMTIWLIWTFVGWIDGWVLPFIPWSWRPDTLLENYLGYTPAVGVRGVGVVIFLIFTVFIGWIAKGLIGRQLLAWGERLVGRMPLVRSVYNGLKQIADSLLRQDDAKFDRACLIEFPRKGVWAVGFVSTPAKGEIAEKIPDEEILTVFLATNVVPPSGFLLYVPRRDVILLEKMTVEDTAKLILSAGLVYPSDKAAENGGRKQSARPALPKV